MGGRYEQHELVTADRHFQQAFLGRAEGERPEIEAALLHFNGNLARRHATDVGGNVGIALTESRNQREQRMHRRLVGADQHAPAPQVAQIADGGFGFLRQPHQPVPVVLEHPARFGEGSCFRRPVEELFAEVVFEPAHRLADGGLGPVHFGGRPGEAALLGDGEEDLQCGQIHWPVIINQAYLLVITIALTSSPAAATNAV
jgi:hypothetical protein